MARRAPMLLAVASCVAVLMISTAGASRMLQTTCGVPTCPKDYTVVMANSYLCDYACLSPVKMNCVGTYTPKSWWQKLYQPYLCGGTSGKPCPAISCGYVSSYSVSGPNGCAFAKSVIDTTSVAASTYSAAVAFAASLKSYCDSPSAYPLQAFAWAAANSYAETVVQTIAHWNVYVCNCGCGALSANYAVVKADLQSVANAVASSYTEALSGVETCMGDLLAGTLQKAYALANDTQVAIDKVYAAYVYAPAGSAPTCATTGVQTQIKEAVAKAAACTFVEAFAAAANEKAMDTGLDAVSYGCGTALSFTQINVDLVCPPYGIGCDCTPEYLGYTNLGFENGIPGANPAWTVVDQATAVPSDTLSPQGITLKPSQGALMAKITAGSYASKLSTAVKVPKCVDNYNSPRILLDYVFKCNDYQPFDDSASITITLYDGFGAVSASQTFKCSDPEISKYGDASGDYGVSNGGSWSTLILTAPPGTYTMAIEGTSTNRGDTRYDSVLYLDNIRFK